MRWIEKLKVITQAQDWKSWTAIAGTILFLILIVRACWNSSTKPF